MNFQRHSSGVGVSHGGGLNLEAAAVVRETKEEYSRRGSWVRIFPTEDSWDLYGSVKIDAYSCTHFLKARHLSQYLQAVLLLFSINFPVFCILFQYFTRSSIYNVCT